MCSLRGWPLGSSLVGRPYLLGGRAFVQGVLCGRRTVRCVLACWCLRVLSVVDTVHVFNKNICVCCGEECYRAHARSRRCCSRACGWREVLAKADEELQRGD